MKNTRFTLFALLFFTFLGTNLSFGQYAPKQVDSIVDYAMGKFNMAGCAVAIVKDGQVVYNKGFGVKDVKTKQDVNSQTNFAIASNSKAFTVAALALLIEEEKLKWDDKVIKYIPEFKMYNDYVTQNFNIKDLLSHRSGMGLGVGDLMLFPDGASFTIDDCLTNFQYFEPVSALRTKYDYNNVLYIVAGEVIKRVSGMSWEDFVTKRIFEPLQMNHSYAAIDRMKDKSNLAKPHDSNTGKLLVLADYGKQINGAAFGIYANVDDLAKWMIMQLNNGKYGENLEKQLFSKESQREMWTIQTVSNVNRNPRNNSHFAGYGLGWNLTDINGNMSVSHTGGMPGMLSKTILIPDINLGIVILTNTSDDGGPFFGAISNTLVDSYLGMNDFGYIDKYATSFKNYQERGASVTQEAWKVVESADASKIKFENYIGIYKDPWFGNMEVFKKGNKLWMKSHKSPMLNGQMYFYEDNTFAVKWEYQAMNADAFAIFTVDDSGKAQGLKMKGISPNIDFSFDFHDLNLVRVEGK